jgi:hypothetical protein
MSAHPNAILMLTLQPDDLPRKTMRAILVGAGADPDEESPSIKIGAHDYHVKLMEESYYEGYQIAAPEGSIVIFDMVTYGYGEKIAWDALVAQQAALAKWAQEVSEKHHCTVHEIAVSANYW